MKTIPFITGNQVRHPLVRLAGLIFIIVVTIINLASCSGESIEVRTTSVMTGSLSETVKASGIIVADQSQAVTSNLTGDIREVLVEEGDDIAKDQTLISLNRLCKFESIIIDGYS